MRTFFKKTVFKKRTLEIQIQLSGTHFKKMVEKHEMNIKIKYILFKFSMFLFTSTHPEWKGWSP